MSSFFKILQFFLNLVQQLVHRGAPCHTLMKHSYNKYITEHFIMIQQLIYRRQILMQVCE